MSSSSAPDAGAPTGDLLQALADPSTDHGRTRQLTGGTSVLVGLVAVAFSVFQLWWPPSRRCPAVVTRSIHVGFLLLLAFLLYPPRERSPHNRLPWFDLAHRRRLLRLGLYHRIFEADLVQRGGDPTATDMVVGITVVVLLFEAARRVHGPGPADHLRRLPRLRHVRPVPARRRSIIAAMASTRSSRSSHFGTEGIYGIPTWSRRPTSSSSSCSVPSSSTPA